MAWVRPAGLECAAALAALAPANASFVLGQTDRPSALALLAEWTRPTADTPICLASCQGTSRNPNPGPELKPGLGFWGQNKAFCPATLTWRDVPEVEYGGVCTDFTPAAVP